jgi:MFS transporter, FSR family, fosmidomycin resistance protein
MGINVAPWKRFALLKNRPLMALMLGHLTIDSYVGLLPVLYPLLIDKFALDLKTVGLLTLAYSGIASLAQPFFGWLADRFGTRRIGLALIWTALLFATIGFAPSFGIVLALAAAAGLGSGAYHPLGALMARAVSPAEQRNTAMSVYVTGGTVGVAIAPLFGALIFSFFGPPGTALMLIPGLCIAAWLLAELRSFRVDAPALEPAQAGAAAAVPLLPMIAVVGVMMSRTWTVYSLETFIPSWYESMGYDAGFYGPLAATLVLASAFGTVGSGSLADRYGRRIVIIGSLVLTIPALLLFAQFTGPIAFVTAALIGLSAASTGPLMLVMAQQLMNKRAGMASGLILGIGFLTGAIGVPITGAIADTFGMPAAIRSQVLLVIATIALAWLLPTETYLHDWQQRTAINPDQQAPGVQSAGQ